ncbi:MAG: hypothetical protein HKN82_05815 [Akkermansiaceae bacterium]|nr:hypothetical protein [Akkermansiaceae bacterium]
MKSFAITTLLAAFVAYAGSFLQVWVLPHQKDPYTIQNMKPGLRKVFDFTDEARSARIRTLYSHDARYPDRGTSFGKRP